MATSFGLPFCLAAVLKLIHDICQFVGPVMLEKITIFLSDTTETETVFFSVSSLLVEEWINICCCHVFLCDYSKSLSS